MGAEVTLYDATLREHTSLKWSEFTPGVSESFRLGCQMAILTTETNYGVKVPGDLKRQAETTGDLRSQGKRVYYKSGRLSQKQYST